MTTKAAEAIETNASILYDPAAKQTIPVNLKKAVRRNGKRVFQHIRLEHTVNPLSNDRYLELEADLNKQASRAKTVAEHFNPKLRLYADVKDSVKGYPDDQVPEPDQICVVDALLGSKILSEEEIEYDLETSDIEEVEEITDDEATLIPFRAMFNGALITNMAHGFRSPSKADMDTFIAIESNEPDGTRLASSAEQPTTAERLYRLGKKMLVDTEGYVEGAEIPAWHLVATCRTFMLRELGRMGKSLSW